ncbi:MAG TPA: rhamnogalacturonan acetylesterase [Pyrinomonadaceae bacterium]|nr:rhamnogalacturonan acetylesterase [Pyrinomonadaceae bacterium]
MKQNCFVSIVVLGWLFGIALVIEAQDRTELKLPDKRPLPTLFIIGDSTVNNSGEGVQGWGNVIGKYFDESKIKVVNRARGGRSSRTFQTEGLWDQIMPEFKPGDFVLIQFGHNDGGPLDKERARGSLKGIGEETRDITIEATERKVTVHTFGWYMRKYVADSKGRGADAIVLSPVPRNIWKDGKVVRASGDYGLWAKEVAAEAGALFVDLNEITARRYEKDGQAKVNGEYFTNKDHTHTSPAGAKLNAASVIDGLLNLKKSPLKKYILKK